MTKNKLFTFLMISLIGGFVLSTPYSALAKARNSEKEKSVQDFIDSYGIKKDQQGNTVLTRQKKLAEIKSKFEKEEESFDEDFDEVLGDCAQAYGERVEGAWKSLTGDVEETVSDVKDADGLWGKGWELLKGSVSFGWEAAKLTFEASGAGWTTEKVTTLIVDGASDFVLGDDVSYIGKVNYAALICKDAGKYKDYEKKFEELRTQAENLEDLNYTKSLLEAEGYGDEIYVHCPPVEEGGCTADEAKGEDFQTKCCLQFIINTEKNTLMSISGASAGCPTLSFKLYEARSCLFCPLFETIFNTIQKASTLAYTTFGKPLSTLVLIGLSIWIAFMVLANVSSLNKQEAPKFLNDLFKASFKVVIVFFLLSYSSIIYEIIIGPLLKAGLDFGASFLSKTVKSGDMLSKCDYVKDASTTVVGVFPSYLYNHLMCFIEAIEYELGTVQAIGSSLMCASVNAAKSNLLIVAKIMPDFSMMLQGAIIFLVSFILSIAFAFYLIDATVSLGIFGMLLPFLLLCWPFKPTNGYFKKGVEVFMNSWFVYVFMGVVTSVTIELIGQALSGGKGGFDAVMRAINSNYVKTLQSLLAIGFSGFLILIACCVFAIKLMMKVEDLASKFAGGGLGLGIGGKIGGLAASTATNLAKTGVGMTIGAAKGAYNAQIWEEKDENGNYTGKFSSAHDKVSAVKTKMTRGIVGGLQRGASAVGRAGSAVGRAVTRPFSSMLNTIRGGRRRNPSA